MDDTLSQFPLLYPLIAFIGVVLLVLPLRALAGKVGLTDTPGGRKDHQGEIPLIGGLAIFVVFILVSVMAGYDFNSAWPLYSAILVLLLTGVVDDYVHLPAFIKFGMQFVAAGLVVIPGGAELYDLGNLFGLGAFELGFMSLPFSIVAVVLLINAINLMDGLDGLAGGTSFVILGWFVVACFLGGDVVFNPSILILLGALAGFLVYNMRSPFRSKASVFLGDAGSMSLGLMIGWYAIHLSPAEARIMEPISVAWVMALPIWDECAQFNRRVREGRHPFSPDRGHFHHHFIQAGLTPEKSVSMILGIILLSGFVGIVGIKIGAPLACLTVVWIIGILAHIAFSKDLEKYPALITKLLIKRSSE